MKMILTRLAPGTGVRDVVAFLQNGVKWRFPLPMREAPKVAGCQIIKIVDGDSGYEDHIALVQVTPGKAALRAIQRLNRTPLKGRIVEVREYRSRSSRNERRSRPYPVASEHERRAEERRRPNLKFEKHMGPMRFEAVEGFRRTHGF